MTKVSANKESVKVHLNMLRLSYPVGLEVFVLRAIICIHIFCMQALKALARLHACEGSCKPWLHFYGAQWLS